MSVYLDIVVKDSLTVQIAKQSNIINLFHQTDKHQFNLNIALIIVISKDSIHIIHTYIQLKRTFPIIGNIFLQWDLIYYYML